MYKRKKVPLCLLPEKPAKPIFGVGPGAGIAFFEAYFPEAENTIRIASAYFTLKGYKLVRDLISKEVKIHILVGREEDQNVESTVLSEIEEELGQCETELWNSVYDLVQRIKKKQFFIKDAREMQAPFHCKFYMCDNKTMWDGSANFSHRGLTVSSEQITVSKNLQQIEQFRDWFDEVSFEAKDLLAEISERLDAWLQLASPYSIYLKTLLSLSSIPEYFHRKGRYQPIYYQKAVIASALRQVDEYGGAVVVAATGLGKTVMGAEIAHRLSANKKIKRVILFAPNAVHENWKEQFTERDILYSCFNSDLLFRKKTDISYHKVNQLEKELEDADSDTLIIIDEVHFARNELLKKFISSEKSLVYQRLKPLTNNGSKIILLTATAYGTNIQNLNSLLHLIPPRTASTSGNMQHWEVSSPDEFAQLPVVTILGLPHVLSMARNRGDIDQNKRLFFQFPEERRYLPKIINLHSIKYSLFMEGEFQSAFDSNLFTQAAKIPQFYFDDDSLSVKTGVADTIYNLSLNSWLSSPQAIKETTLKNIVTPGKQDAHQDDIDTAKKHPNQYNTSMQLGEPDRKPLLKLIVEKLNKLEVIEDDKLFQLINIVDQKCEIENGKIIIFVNKRSTAFYLKDKLSFYSGKNIFIDSTIEKNDSKYRLKKVSQRIELQKQFSPRSHNHETPRECNILICTDADSVGVNLQDADIIVNYDPPEGADKLFQRVGRILRMTDNPDRVVHVYNLIPSIIGKRATSKVHKQIASIFRRITQRHDKSKSILGSSVFSHDTTKAVHLDKEAHVEKLSRDSELLGNVENIASRYLMNHFATLEKNREQAELLPDYIQSARAYDYAQERIFVLLQYRNQVNLLIYNIATEVIESRNELEVLELLACKSNEPPAFVNPSIIESYANQAARKWCKSQNAFIEEVKKICTLYLIPKGTQKGIKQLFKNRNKI